MALKTYKPTTPSQRNLVLVDRTGLYRGKPVKSLVEGQHSTGGATTMAASPAVSAAAATSRPIAPSTSSARAARKPRPSSASNTIRTVQPSSRW
jgi:ribosomal protein L2